MTRACWLVEFKNKTDSKFLINGKALDWEKKLPNLDSYEIVISDNLPDILKYKNIKYVISKE